MSTPPPDRQLRRLSHRTSRLRGVIAAILVLAAAGAEPRAVAGSATDPTSPGTVQLLANCLDLCTLTVKLSGTGSGSWQSTNGSYVPNGLINCVWLNGAQAPGSDCSQVYGGDVRATPFRVYFLLTPSTGSRACYANICDDGPFSSYYDLPSFSGPTSTELASTFNVLTFYTAVSRAGSAASSGAVLSSPAGIECPPDCFQDYAYGTALTLTAGAGPGSYFDHWSGTCAGQSAACHLTITTTVDTTATFTLGSPPTASPPAPTPSPTAHATVKPTGTPRPSATGAPAQTGPATTGPPSSSSTETGAPGTPVPETTTPATTDSVASPGSSGPTATEPPGDPAVSVTDLTPIVLAILGAGLLIAIGIGFAAYMLRRKAPPAA